MYFLINRVLNRPYYQLREYNLFGEQLRIFEFPENGVDEIIYINGFQFNSVDTGKVNVGVGSTVKRVNSSIIVESDYAGREPIFYSIQKDSSFASNSFAILFDYLNESGFNLTINDFVASAQMNSLWIFETLAFHQSLINQIKVVPARSYFNMKVIEIISREDNYFVNHDYHSVLNDLVEYLRGYLDQLFDLFEFPILSLSGGQDSRILLAAALTLDSSKIKRLTISSIKNKRSEFSVVQDICKRFNLNLNIFKNRTERQIIENEIAISRWRSANLGWSFQPNFSNKIMFANDSVVIRGGQVHASYYPIVLKKWISEIKLRDEATYFQYCNLLCDGISENINDAINSHYKYFRYRIHYGCSNYLSSINPIIIDPLINPYYEELSDRLTFEEKEQGRLCRDICKVLEPSLLNFIFDKENNSISKKFIDDFSPDYIVDQFVRTKIEVHLPEKANFSDILSSVMLDKHKFEPDILKLFEENNFSVEKMKEITLKILSSND